MSRLITIKSYWKQAPWAWSIICFWVLMALLAPIIATDQPWAAKYDGKTRFPAFAVWFNEQAGYQNQKGELVTYQSIEWKNEELEWAWFAPIPYSTTEQDKLNNDYVSPFDAQKDLDKNGQTIELSWLKRHWLGTTALGQDVLAGLIHGSAMVIKVALTSILLASFIGIFIGAFAGYFGDDGLKMTKTRMAAVLLALVLGYFWAFESRLHILQHATSVSVSHFVWHLLISILTLVATVAFFNFSIKWFEKKRNIKPKTALPVDLVLSRIMEVFHAIPRLLLIISFSALFQNRSLTAVVVLIGCTAWTGIARYMRAEMLKVKNMDYIKATRVMGFSWPRIIFKHALPNAFGPVSIEIVFAFASAVMLESVLSFLSIGVPDDALSWGTLLNYGRQQFDAWWLVVFPGLAIASLVWALSSIAEYAKKQKV